VGGSDAEVYSNGVHVNCKGTVFTTSYLTFRQCLHALPLLE